MAITTSKMEAPAADKNQGTEASAEKPTFRLELTKIGRYLYGNQLYLKNEHYVFDEHGARHMLALRDPAELPVFRIAKPRKRLVEVDDDTGEIVSLKPRPTRVDRVVMDLQDFKFGDKKPEPIGRIDLGDDDVDTAERLAAVDAQGASEAGLVDTAGATTL